ncbi:MAG: VUT family protein [Trueperaceae bacterium]|nr:VUT family protein [Trueperaceae bacterium]
MTHRFARFGRSLEWSRLALLPPLILLGVSALRWMAGFGQDPADRLPWAELAFFGALFGDALAGPLRRQGRLGAVTLASGAAVCLLLGVTLLPARDLAAPGVALASGLLLALPSARRAEMWGAISVYTASTLLANYTFDAFLPLGDWFLVNVGTLFFGVTFTQRDRVHRFGRAVVYRMIVLAAVANVAAALTVGTPLRYVAVGFLAIVASESADTEIYQRMLRHPWLARVASSNAVSAPLDTILFTVLAFAGAPFATLSWMGQVITTDVLVKYASSMATAFGLLAGRALRAPAAAAEPGGGT